MPDAPILSPAQRSFVERARRATLATIAPTGRPRLVPVCFAFVADGGGEVGRIYSPLDEKPKASDDPRELARVRDILVRPEATLLIDRWSEDWAELGWLRLDCVAELIEPDGPDAAEHAAAVDALRERYRQYAGHRLEGRPVIRLTVERATTWGNLAGAAAG
ncbi:MAG TPA: TIGR03668 family PPOX class F420-dependent oxidoreductase [Candidatus Limnocylindrales bacterium]|nr:TIGR03668 family PPOX class F420-dependent oxidoreductase [Candidatus Limnocylindrales bacterium]